jgi:hypothetical protein
MVQVNRKLENLSKMIIALERAIQKLGTAKQDEIEFIQDSVVARFKILVEFTWKNMALNLELQGFSDLPSSPKGLVNFALAAKFITSHEAEALIKFITLLNLAAHLYDQPQYILIVHAAPDALVLIKQIYQRILAQQIVLG